MKNEFGYTVKYVDGELLRHEYVIDGCNHEGAPELGLWTIEDTYYEQTKAEALKRMRQMCKHYDKVTIYDNWVEDEGGCTVSQKITDYVKGKPIGGIKI